MDPERAKMIKEIMEDAKQSKAYLNESGDTTSARARRCLNIVLNSRWLMMRDIADEADQRVLESVGTLYDIESFTKVKSRGLGGHR